MSILAFDSFRRLAFGTSTVQLGPAWSNQGSVSDWTIDGTNKRAKPSSFGSDGCNLFTAGSPFPRDQYAQATIVAVTGSGAAGSGGGLVVRGDTFAETGYYVYVTDAAGVDTYIVRRLAGVVTVLDSSDNGWLAGDVIYLQVSGTTISVKKNGVQVASTTDSNISYGWPGLAYSSTITNFVVDDFEAGDLNATISVPLLQLVTDNFNRADSSGLGGNWSSVTGETLPDIVSNQASSAIDPFGARYSAISWPNNQYSQIKLTGTLTTSQTDGAGVAVRMNTGGERTYYSFVLGAHVAAGAGEYGGRLSKYSSGTETELNYFDIGATNDTIYLQIIGNTLTTKINGSTVFIVTDKSITSGQAGVVGAGAPDTITFDDWEGGGDRNWILKR